MVLEEFSVIISELKRKLLYIVAVFIGGTLFSFQYVGGVIKKIENDMFYGLNLHESVDTQGLLVDISNNLSSMSKELAAGNPAIAHNLTKVSGELLNISQNLNFHKSAIVYLTPMEVLMLEFKMSLISGVVVASPLVIYYAYRGLRGRFTKIIPVGKSLLVSITLAAAVLFFLGAVYSYCYMLPFFLKYIYQDAMSLGVNATFSIYDFIYFVVMTTVILGFAFELPLILTLLVHLGITSRQTLAHYRKHAYIILLIIAAWITPDPTMFSQIMVTVPFVILYEISLLVMKLTGK